MKGVFMRRGVPVPVAVKTLKSGSYQAEVSQCSTNIRLFFKYKINHISVTNLQVNLFFEYFKVVF